MQPLENCLVSDKDYFKKRATKRSPLQIPSTGLCTRTNKFQKSQVNYLPILQRQRWSLFSVLGSWHLFCLRHLVDDARLLGVVALDTGQVVGKELAGNDGGDGAEPLWQVRGQRQ